MPPNVAGKPARYTSSSLLRPLLLRRECVTLNLMAPAPVLNFDS